MLEEVEREDFLRLLEFRQREALAYLSIIKPEARQQAAKGLEELADLYERLLVPWMEKKKRSTAGQGNISAEEFNELSDLWAETYGGHPSDPAVKKRIEDALRPPAPAKSVSPIRRRRGQRRTPEVK